MLAVVLMALGVLASAAPLCAAAATSPSPGTSTPARATAAPVSGKLVPAAGRRLLLVGQDVDSIADYVAAVGRVPAGVTGYSSLARLEGLVTAEDWGAGRNHLDELARRYPQSVLALGLSLVDQLERVVDGSLDAHLDWLIGHLASYDRPVFLRWGYEFDGSWNHYQPARYKAAWVRAHERIRARGAEDRIALVWQGASYCDDSADGRSLETYYPGDDRVDWVGLSYFRPQDCGGRAVDAIVAFARQHGKPVLIAEAAPQRYDTARLTASAGVDGSNRVAVSAEQIWRDWYQGLFSFISRNSDVIAGLAYINADWDSQKMWGAPYTQGYWGDSRVQANPTIERNWRHVTGGDEWLQASPELFRILGVVSSAP